MKGSGGEPRVNDFFYSWIAEVGHGKSRGQLCLWAVSTNELEFIFRFAFGVVLVFFLFLFHHLHHVTFPITMHLRFVPVYTEILGNIAAVKPEIQYNKQFVERLYQQSQKH
jgi:hypothetical protein